MNERDIARIEKTTDCSLPADYAKLLGCSPRELFTLLDLRPADERMLFTDAATIIRWNKFFRAANYVYEDSNGEIHEFPPHHIVIGANGGGDFYHLNSVKKRCEVLCWCHDDGEFLKQAKNLREFVRQIFLAAADSVLSKLA